MRNGNRYAREHAEMSSCRRSCRVARTRARAWVTRDAENELPIWQFRLARRAGCIVAVLLEACLTEGWTRSNRASLESCSVNGGTLQASWPVQITVVCVWYKPIDGVIERLIQYCYSMHGRVLELERSGATMYVRRGPIVSLEGRYSLGNWCASVSWRGVWKVQDQRPLRRAVYRVTAEESRPPVYAGADKIVGWHRGRREWVMSLGCHSWQASSCCQNWYPTARIEEEKRKASGFRSSLWPTLTRIIGSFDGQDEVRVASSDKQRTERDIFASWAAIVQIQIAGAIFTWRKARQSLERLDDTD